KKVFVFADKEQISRVFINLVRNGMQSVPDSRNGRIDIRMEIADDKRVVVMITDNGKGIPEGIRDRLFQPNFTTKSGGMGMGLAISYNIIRSLGGKIWFETEVNKGTTFYVELPMIVDKT
ncbi:MAG: sensor histidine kinase, partial [Bacteroidales bacterium]